jgi:Uma2 family endonuclease
MAAPLQKMTASEFLAWERQQEVRHEFVDGEVFAMAGASRAHVRTVMNLGALLSRALVGRPCEPFSVDMKVLVSSLGRYFYPDVFVTCSDADRRATDVMTEPTVIIEVLSDSTAAYDRGDKFWAYRHLSTLQEYVLVDPERLRIEIFRRGPSAFEWSYESLPAGQALLLKSLGVSLDPLLVFENVSPPNPSPA